MINEFLDEELKDIQSRGLKRKLRLVTGSQGPEIVVEGKKCLNFCSNNYLGLANDPRLTEAAYVAMKEEGFGAGASRLVCGNMSAHQKLEKKIIEFKQCEAALVFNTGYMANVGVISSLFNRSDWIFSDKLNHASIVDGIKLCEANFRRYPHNDMEGLERVLKSTPAKGKRCIITDTVFSMDGDVARLPEIVKLAKQYNCMVMIDEAHGVGVMGEHGRGLAEHFDVEKDIDIQIGTLSKALGSFGAYCAGSRKLIDYLTNTARSFIYTTALPPAAAAASTEAISIIQCEPGLMKNLWDNTRYVKSRLQEMGFDTMDSQTPIIPILIKDNDKAVEFSKKLFENGIFVSAIRPPTVPIDTARLRLTVMASHSRENLNALCEKLQSIGKDLCLI